MKLSAKTDREADLLIARQLGQLYTIELKSTQILLDFATLFGDDQIAKQEFDAGAIEEDQKRLTLRLTPEQYHRRRKAR